MDESEKLNIQPPASIYGTFSRYSYKVWYAIAEFVDNSTSSFYTHSNSLKFYNFNTLRIDIEYNQNENTLKITDNAFGMEIKDFKRAILLNSKPENNEGRNEFGMGLKTAASWFGKVWSVTSTQLGSEIRYSATVDIPFLEKNNVNEIDIVKTKCDKLEHGTVIEIKELTKGIDGARTIGKIKDILRSMYRRDLNSGKVIITYNGEKLYFSNYGVLCSGGKEWRKNLDFNFEFEGINHHITGYVALLGEGSHNDKGSYSKAGFALFRRDRVVIGSEGEYYKPYDIFGQSQSRISLNMFGELNLDDFPVNQAKDGFVWDNGLEEQFIASLKIQVSDYMKLADEKRKQKSDDFDPNDKRQIENTKKETQKSLNKLNTSENVTSDSPSEEEIKTEEQLEFEKAFVNNEDEIEKIYSESTTQYTIPTSIGNETVNVTWSNAGGAYWYSFDKQKDEIIINISHPFFQPFCTSPDFRNVLNKFVIAIYLAEQRSELTSQQEGYAFVDDINNEINDILKRLAN